MQHVNYSIVKGKVSVKLYSISYYNAPCMCEVQLARSIKLKFAMYMYDLWLGEIMPWWDISVGSILLFKCEKSWRPTCCIVLRRKCCEMGVRPKSLKCSSNNGAFTCLVQPVRLKFHLCDYLQVKIQLLLTTSKYTDEFKTWFIDCFDTMVNPIPVV